MILFHSFFFFSYQASLLTESYRVSGDEVSVALMNVTPTARPTIPPSTAPPPSCKGDASYLQYSKEEGWIGFRGASLLAIQPPDGDVLLSYFRVKYVIVIKPLRLVSTKSSCILKQTCNWKVWVCLNMYDLLLDTRR